MRLISPDGLYWAIKGSTCDCMARDQGGHLSLHGVVPARGPCYTTCRLNSGQAPAPPHTAQRHTLTIVDMARS